MSIIIKTSDKDISFNFDICFDLYGNLYLDGNKHVNNKYFIDESHILNYQINITGRNIPYADPGKYTIINNYSKKINTFHQLQKDLSLKDKVKLKKEQENMDDIHTLNDFEDDEYDSDEEYKLYYPEEEEYVENEYDSDDSDSDLIDEDNINKYGTDNKQFKFSVYNIDYKLAINNRENGDIAALYDTYIYDNGKLCFKSNSTDSESIYRIKLFDDGKLLFRPIGYQEKYYELYIDKHKHLDLIPMISTLTHT
jgi:hypothetical protein